MPVAYSMRKNNTTLSGFYFGWTINVHPLGICIQARPRQIPEKGCRITLLVVSNTNDRLSKADVSVRIQGEVIWVNRQFESFGVSLLHNE